MKLTDQENAFRLEVLKRNHWNVHKSAREIGISHQALFRWIAKRVSNRPKPRRGPSKEFMVKTRKEAGKIQKLCRSCAKWKNLDLFAHNRTGGVFGRENVCKACRKEERDIARLDRLENCLLE
jgi:superfamily II helicase